MYDYATVSMQQDILAEISSVSSQLGAIYILLGVVCCFQAIKLIYSIVRSCLWMIKKNTMVG